MFKVCNAVLASTVAALALGLASPAYAQMRNFDLPSQDLAQVIPEFARQAGVRISAPVSGLKGRRAPPINGQMDLKTALSKLIAGSGLEVASNDGSTVVLRRVSLTSNTPETPVGASAPSSADAAIVVTGSRIARPEVDSPMPVVVTKMDDAMRFGRTTAYEALTLNPALGAGLDGNHACFDCGRDANAGISAPNLRNLGVNRSLTLIDGQRRVSGTALVSAVDVNMIPVGMIDRMEVVTGGAAAVYGADAVTGVVNILTKDRVERTSITAQTGIASKGDAEQFMGSITTGSSFADGRGSFVVGGTYRYTSPLFLKDRYGAKKRLQFVPNPANTGPNDGIPDNEMIDELGYIYLGFAPNFYLNGKEYIIEGDTTRLGTYDRMLVNAVLSNGIGGDGRNIWDTEQIRAETKSLSLMGRYDYELTDTITYSGHFSYSQQKFQQQLELLRSDNRPGLHPAYAYLDNPYLPASTRQMMLDNNLTELNIRRTYGNIPGREAYYESQIMTVGQELKGKLTNSINWQGYFQYGRSNYDALETGSVLISRWNAARDVVIDLATGAPACRDLTARAQGCLPYNIFSTERVSQDFLNYVSGDRTANRVNTQYIVGASINGQLFALPYGDLSIAVGAEFRQDELETLEDSRRSEFQGALVAVPNLNVKANVKEMYGEIIAPLLAGVPFAHRLELEAAYRYSDYSTSGSTNTWKVGGTWTPIQGLSFRGVVSRSVRAPNFGELYEPQTLRGGGTIVDPCDYANYNYSETRKNNCRALGIVTPLGLNTGQYQFLGGGNANLKAEKSDSFTLGVIMQPRFIPGLDVTVDYWNIDIKDAIQSYSNVTILNMCVDLPTIDNDFCRVIQRHPVTKVASYWEATKFNAARQVARGIDIGVHYRRPVGPGNVSVSFNGTYLIENMTETTPGVSAGNIQIAGGWQNPRFRGTLQLAYNIGKFGIANNTRIIGASQYDVNAMSDEVYSKNRVPHKIYNDFALSFAPVDDFNMTFGLRNVFDVKPAYYPTLFLNSGVYDQVGRYFFVSGNITL